MGAVPGLGGASLSRGKPEWTHTPTKTTYLSSAQRDGSVGAHTFHYIVAPCGGVYPQSKMSPNTQKQSAHSPRRKDGPPALSEAFREAMGFTRSDDTRMRQPSHPPALRA